MCMSLTHRMQLLLEPEQYDRLAQRARVEGRSMGALIREAIDLAWVAPDAQRQVSANLILDAEPMDVPSPDALRRELDETRAGRFA